MIASDIDRIVTMSQAEYARRLLSLKQAEQEAYRRYCQAGSVPHFPPGSPGRAGHGSWVCNLSPHGEQEAWYAAQRAVRVLRDARTAWSLVRITGGIAVYCTTVGLVNDICGDRLCHQVEIETHGVDVSDCPTPSQAIERVRQSPAA